MKSSVETLSTLERKLNIEVPAEEVQAAFEKAFKGVQKQANIKGFRKGKAPLSTVRSLYGERVKQDVMQDIIQRNYQTALDEHKLSPISYPAIEFDSLDDMKLDQNGTFSFTAEFEIRPEVKSPNFEGLVVKKERATSGDDLIDKTLEDIRKSRAEATPILEDRPAQTGDVAVIDFEGHLLTGPLENGSAQDHELELGSNQFIPGFEEGLAGMRLGQTKDIGISFPEDYHVKELAGKPVTFKTVLKGLKKKSLPELNDEFAKSMGPYESLQALRDAIGKDNLERETKRIGDDFKNRLLRALVAKNPVSVPKSLMTDQKKALIEDFKKRMAQQGMPEQDFEQYKEKWDADFEKTASFMIQSSFLIDAIAEEQGLHAKKEDIEAKLKEYAAQTGLEIARIREFYGEKERSSRLAYQVTEEKVVDLLASKAKVTEITKEEAEAEDRKDS
jgi:trigger factor